MNKPIIWAEVEYTVIIVEKGTAKIPIELSTTIISSTDLLAASNAVAKLRSSEVISDSDNMELQDVKTTWEVTRFFPDMKGQPVDSPIELEDLSELFDEPGTNH